jgi:IS605 OrfB family transposase
MPSSLTTSTRVLRLRLRDKHAARLGELAREVNFVWNYCNELGFKIWQRERRFASAFDLHPYTRGATKEGLSLHSQSVQAVTEELVTRRKQFKKSKLRWRVSGGSRRSLGWIPFKASAIRYRNGQVFLAGIEQPLGLWDSYGLAGYKLGAGSVSEDARGRWYLNVTVKVAKKPQPQAVDLGEALGIDLGLKSLMADSEGAAIEAQRFYRDLQPALASAQRARRKPRIRAIHAKIANRRKDFLHKLSTQQARSRAAIFVGNVNSSALARTHMAKSVLDAGWSAYRTMLQYKCDDAGVWFKEVDERFSTQNCSACGARTGPKGREELDIRRWSCSACGVEHDRDVNAAVNIRQRGLAWLEKEFSEAGEARAVEAASNRASGAQCARAGAGHGPPEVGIPVL